MENEHLLRIGDFSKMAQVSVPTLRHYDDVGLLRPAHVDKFTEYRYYTLEQLPRLNRILAFKDLGFGLSQIGKLIDDNVSAEQMRGMLKLRRGDAEQAVRNEALRLLRIEARLRQIEQEGKPSQYDVTMKQVTAQTILSTRKIVPSLIDMDAYRCPMYEGLYEALRERSIYEPAAELMLYHNHEYTETNIDMEAAITLSKKDVQTLDKAIVPAHMLVRELPESNETACVIHHGEINDVTQAIIAVFAWMAQNSYTCVQTASRELHHFGREHDLVDLHAPVVMEIQVAVQKVQG